MNAESSELETIKFFLTDKINTLEQNIGVQLGDIKDLMGKHVEHCEHEMDTHEGRIQVLEAHKNKATGIMIGISSVAGFVSAIVVLLIDKLW